MVELLAVIVIVGILATVGVIAVTNIISNSENKSLVEEGLNLAAAGRYAYENNENLSNKSMVCISLETLNETGYYEKGKSEDYYGSVLITNNGSKITIKFWINNKDNEKAIEGANLTATEDNVSAPKITNWDLTQTKNNGSFCNLTQAELDNLKNSGSIPGSGDLNEYTGDKITINLNVENPNINNDITGLECNNKKEECPVCPPSGGSGTGTSCTPYEYQNTQISSITDTSKNYLVFKDDCNYNTLFRYIGTQDVELANGTHENLRKLVQDDWATNFQAGFDDIDHYQIYNTKYTVPQYTGYNTSGKYVVSGINGDNRSLSTVYGDRDYCYNFYGSGNAILKDGGALYQALNKTYIDFLKNSAGVNTDKIPTIHWLQPVRCITDCEGYSYKQSYYDKCVSQCVNAHTPDLIEYSFGQPVTNPQTAQVAIMTVDEFNNNSWINKNTVNELLFDAWCKPAVNGGSRTCQGTWAYYPSSNKVEHNGLCYGAYFRPTFYISNDTKIYAPKDVAQNQWGSKDHPYIIVQ